MSQRLNHPRTTLFARTIIPALLFVGVSLATCFAQDNQNRADVARAQTELGPSVEVAPSANDSDLGEQVALQPSGAGRYQPFTVSAVVPCYWTSNAALTHDDEESDWITAPGVALGYQPSLGKNVYGVLAVREQLFYYNRHDELNFGAFDLDAGFVYLVPQWHNLILRAEFIYERLTDKNSFDSFFDNYSIYLAAEVPFQLGSNQSLSLGADANISMDATPEPPRRNDYGVYGIYSIGLTSYLSLDAVGRVVLRTYQLTDRVDMTESFSANLNLKLTDWATASAITSLAANQSNRGVFQYKVANVGGLLSLTVRF